MFLFAMTCQSLKWSEKIFREINSLVTYLCSKAVGFTKFLSKNCVREFPQFSHCAYFVTSRNQVSLKKILREINSFFSNEIAISRKFTLIHFWQKFRESNVFDDEIVSSRSHSINFVNHRRLTLFKFNHFGIQSFWNPIILESNHFGIQSFWNPIILESNHFEIQSFWNPIILESKFFGI